MATSLARQLALLRTPGAVKSSLASASSVYSGPFIIPEAEAEHNSVASLKGAVAESLSALCSLDPEMMRFTVLLELEEEEEAARRLTRECLTALCPHILNKHAQWVLQWLVIRHKVHINCPSWLVFNLLPFYSYKIYQTVLQNIDTSIRHGTSDNTWLVGFKQTCVPTSQPGLARHTATNTAFFRFLCESSQQLAKDAEMYQSLKVNKQTTFVLTTLLGGMENIRNISDEQVVLLLQVILSGLKSSNPEMSGLGCILLGYLLPKVTLKQKVLNKLCKSLMKFSKLRQSEDTLNLTLLMSRTQKPEMSKIVELLNKHQPSVNELISRTNNSDHDTDLLDQIDSMLYSLGSILESLIPPQGEVKIACNKEEVEFIETLVSLAPLSKLVMADTAEFTLDVVMDLSKSLEQSDNNKAITKKLTKLSATIGEAWPEAYTKILHKNRSDEGDIFFIPNVEDPSSIELKAAAIIANNQLLEVFSNKVLVEIIPGKGSKKILKNNMNDLITLMKCSTDFLKSQFSDRRLEALLINLLLVSTNQRADLLTLSVIKHLCSQSMIEIVSKKIMLELLLLSTLPISSSAIRSAILGSDLARTSSLLSLLSSLTTDAENFISALMEKLPVILEPGHVSVITNNNCLLHNNTLVTMMLVMAPQLLTSNTAWSQPMVDLLVMTVKRLQVIKSEEEVEKSQDVILNSRKVGYIPWHQYKAAISSLLVGNTEPGHCQDIFVSLPVLVEMGMPDDCLEITEMILNKLNKDALKFLLTVSHLNDAKIACFSLFIAEKYCKENPDVVKSVFKAKSDSTVLFLISALMSDQSKVQKAGFKLLDAIDLSSTGALKPVVQFFMEHKEELLHQSDNIESVLEKETVDAKACRDLLARTCSAENAEIFVQISPLFVKLTTNKDTETLFNFATGCLEDDKDGKASEIVAQIITKFIPTHAKNFESKAMWQFFETSISSNMAMVTAGLRTSVAKLTLTTLTGIDSLKSISSIQPKFLSALTQNSQSESYVEARNFLVFLNPSAQLFMDELSNIWGQEAFSGKRTAGRGKFSLLYGGGDADGGDVQRWSKTCWILEVLEKILIQPESGRSSEYLTLLRPLFTLLRKVSQMEAEETAYKMTTLLNALRSLLTAVSNNDLKNVDQSHVDPELLVFCIRTSPNPDTRHTALQVLARCVIFNPDFILQNSITIFTFMGSHLLKVDSKHSFQVACQALDVIVPAIKTACLAQSGKSAAKLQTASLGVLTTFIDACLDIPAHRLTEFLVRLIRCLGEREYLWFAALLIARKDKVSGERKVVELFCQMGALNGIEAIVRLLVNTRGDSPQLRKMFGIKAERKEDDLAKEKPDDWDVLRYRALQLASSVLSASGFKSAVTEILDAEDGEQLVNLLLEASILTMNCYNTFEVVMPSKFKKNLISLAEKVLENSLSLLHPSTFVGQVSSLLESKEDSVRHRALEVVSSKLTSSTGPALPAADLPALVSPLVKLSLSETQPHTQQLALLGVRQLSKLLVDPLSLKEAAEAFSSSFLQDISNAKVLGAAVLSVGDILTSLGPQVVARVPGLVSWLADRLGRDDLGQSEEWTDKETAVVFNSFLYCLQKLVESFIGFLNPVLPRLILLTCRLSGQDNLVLGRARPLLTSLAANMPPHAVLAAAPQLLESAITDTSALPHLVNFVAENCRRLERNQLSSVSKQFVEFYTNALGYRARDDADPEKVDDMEEAIIGALLSVALKLSLEDFAPVYQKLSNTLILGDDNQHITLFNLTNKIGAKLKSLFSFSVDSLVDFVISTLREERSSKVVTSCLESLTTVLKYNKLETIGLDQYESLVSALLSPQTLEHPGLVPALVQLAISTPEDTNWKHLHFQTLLQLRDERPSVRMAMLSMLTQCVTDRTDTYLPVLPDAVPFLQEILEDDDTSVEAACRNFIQHMETVFGQNLESYFV